MSSVVSWGLLCPLRIWQLICNFNTVQYTCNSCVIKVQILILHMLHVHSIGCVLIHCFRNRELLLIWFCLLSTIGRQGPKSWGGAVLLLGGVKLLFFGGMEIRAWGGRGGDNPKFSQKIRFIKKRANFLLKKNFLELFANIKSKSNFLCKILIF